MTNLFNTEKKINEAIDSFKALEAHPGWILLKQVVQANIEVLEKRVINGFEGETKDDIDRIRDKIRAYRDMIETPENLITNLTKQETEYFDDDPYETVDELREREKVQKQTEES